MDATTLTTVASVLHFVFTCASSHSAQALVRGGVDINGNFEYKIEPEVCLRVDFEPTTAVTPCLCVYHSWPNSYVEIYAYYQIRHFRVKWPVSLCM